MNRRRVDTFADTILFLALGARKEKQGWNRRVATRRRTSREGIQQAQQVVVDGDRRMSSRGEIKKEKGRKKKVTLIVARLIKACDNERQEGRSSLAGKNGG